MNVIKNWLGTTVGGAIAIVLAILFVVVAADSTDFKNAYWLLPIVLVVGGVAFDLYRQGKLKAPTA